MSHVFGHGRLPAYQKAVEFYGWIMSVERRLVRLDACLAERLRVAASAIPMAIAGGAAAAKGTRKATRYRTALGAATECAAILDLFAAAARGEGEPLERGRKLIEEIGTQLGTLQLHAAREVAARSGSVDVPRR